MQSPVTNTDRSCGPSGCETDWLSSRRHEVDLDVVNFAAYAEALGWGDGLPLIPPTEERVQQYIVAGQRYPDETIAVLPEHAENLGGFVRGHGVKELFKIRQRVRVRKENINGILRPENASDAAQASPDVLRCPIQLGGFRRAHEFTHIEKQ